MSGYEMFSPYIPILCSKTGVYRGVPIFLIFDPIHTCTSILWVLVRTALPKRFERVPTFNILSINIESIKNPMKFSFFTAEKSSVYCTGKFS